MPADSLATVRSAGSNPRRVLFIYWGRRGSLGRFTLQLMEAAENLPGIEAVLSVSRQNDAFSDFEKFGSKLLPVDTFERSSGALLNLHRLPGVRRQLGAFIRANRIEAAVTLMPHVWSAMVAPVFKQAGIPYVSVLHDFNPHPGDIRTAIAHSALMQDLQRADRIATLSTAVTDLLVSSGLAASVPVETLFHPDLTFGSPALLRSPPQQGAVWKLLFLGRIMQYKGLPLLVDAVRQLRERGYRVDLGVYGEGQLGAERERLGALGAAVSNRWQTDDEIAAALREHHVLVLSHIEASQSGVAAAALGAGLPVVTTPVGGLGGQIEDGVTGIVADAVSAEALAAAIARLIDDPTLYCSILTGIEARRQSRSMASFASALVDFATGTDRRSLAAIA